MTADARGDGAAGKSPREVGNKRVAVKTTTGGAGRELCKYLSMGSYLLLRHQSGWSALT